MRVVVAALLLIASNASAQVGAPTDAPPADTSTPGEASPPADVSPADAPPPTEPAPDRSETASPWTTPLVPPTAPPPHESPLETYLRGCFPAYAEGHLLVGARSGPANVPEVTIVRWSAGLRACWFAELQVGIVHDEGIDTSDGHPFYFGGGYEARLLVPLAPDLRAGAHIAKLHERTSSGENDAYWVGVRVEYRYVVAGLDLLRMPGGMRDAPYDVWGLYGSIGLRGWRGLIGVAAVSLLWFGNIITNEHGS